MGGETLILHPGSAVGQTTDEAVKRVTSCINQLTDKDSGVTLCVETMAGRGSEIGRTFEELRLILNGLEKPERVGICFDTCHVHDAGYDIVNNLDGVMAEFDRIIGLDRIKIYHINGSKNPLGSRKDRHANIGADDDKIGLDALRRLVWSKYAEGRILILETPWLDDSENIYKREIELLLDC
jgi:deoxyribonuclease-4